MRQSIRGRVLVGSLVVAAHAAVLAWIRAAGLGSLQDSTNTALDDSTSLIALIAPHNPIDHFIPVPEIRLRPVRLDFGALTDVKFEDPDADLVLGVVGNVSVPRPVDSTRLNAEVRGQWEGLEPGTSVTVLLSVEVLVSGETGRVDIVSGSGQPFLDNEAIRYALAIHWIPGSIQRHAAPMRIRFPVTFVCRAA